MRKLRGKRILITGAAQGIGRELALAFGREGAEIILTDLRADLLDDAERAVRRTGARAACYPLDITAQDAIQELRTQLNAEHGPLDMLINNAGVVFGGAFLDQPWERHRTTYEVNMLGMVAMTHAFLPDLISRPEAHLVNIVSASAYIGLPYGTTYASSKWGALGFSESIRLELADQGHRQVRVTAVCPSYVATGLFSGAKAPRTTRFLQPDGLARQTVRAVQRNKTILLTPKSVYLTPFFNGMLPTWALDRIARWFGVNTSMRQWRGRETSESHQLAADQARPQEVPAAD